MKALHLLLIILTFTVTLSAEERYLKVGAKLMTMVTSSLFAKEHIRVFTNDIHYIKVFQTMAQTSLVESCEEADFVVLNDKPISDPVCKERPAFVTKYQLLDEYDNAVGALFWTKGRPQLLFVLSRLNTYSVTLPDNFNPYITSDY